MSKKTIIWAIVVIVAIIAIIAAVITAKNRAANNVQQSNNNQQQSTESQTVSNTNSNQNNNQQMQNGQISLPSGYDIPDDCKNIDFQNDVAVLNTSMGTIKVQLYANDAPMAVVNFDCLIQRGYYNGVIFHRILKDLAIQAGDPTGTGMGGQSIWNKGFPSELNQNAQSYQTGYVAGVVAMANTGQPNSNGSQFFIVPTDQAKTAFAPNYTIFGKVISGMDVVAKINNAPITPVMGPDDGKPVTPITITSASLEKSK